MSLRSAVVTLVSAVLACPALAQTPQGTAFTYQGRLADAGSPADGAFDFQFILYDAAVGGSQVGPIVTRDDVVVTDGLFTVSLDFGASFGGSRRWLDVAVRPGASSGSYTPVVPRQEMTATPNALWSAGTTWTGVAGKPAGFADDTDDDALGALSCANGEVAKRSGNAWVCATDNSNPGTVTSVAAGAGLTGGPITSAGTLGVAFGGGGVSATVARSDHNHHGQTWVGSNSTGLAIDAQAVNSTGLFARASGGGSGYGVVGEVFSNAGVGVYGHAFSTTSASTGVMGVSESTQGVGVYGSGGDFGVRGQSASSFGSALFGWQTSTEGLTYGVKGWSTSSSGRGVSGVALASTGAPYGVEGQAQSPFGFGVYGWATATSGPNAGTTGRTESVDGRGVVGLAFATAGNNFGVWGESWSTAGRGVYGRSFNSGNGTAGVVGESPQGYGVRGSALGTTGLNYGVYGITASSAGYAGYFAGRLHVTGTLSKAAGSFKIDHPLDPENKYLYHSFVESPDMKNVYDGLVTTDDRGLATVHLPDWFEALNRDFRYQLTVLGDGAWARARVARKLEGNAFVVETDLPRVEVSWQVTGIRKDAYAEKHRIPVEEDKPADERGTYLSPEAWGLPRERGLDERHAVPVP
jgi:hypothetical protein